MSKEAWDDILRRRRDREANTELYQVLTPGGGQIHTKAQDLKVGNLVKLHKDQRIPADMILVNLRKPLVNHSLELINLMVKLTGN